MSGICHVPLQLCLGVKCDGHIRKCGEGPYLTIVFQPLGSDPWDGVVLLGGTARHSSEALGRTLLHGGQNGGVDGLVQRDSLLYNSASTDTGGETS